MDQFTLLFIAVAVLACLTGIASTTITTSLSLSALSPSPISGLAITASAVQVFAVFGLVTVAAAFLRRAPARVILVAWIPGSVSCFVGFILSLATLGSTIHLLSERRLYEEHHSMIRGLVDAGLACDAVSLIPHLIFYAITRPRSTHPVMEPPGGGHLAERSPSAQNTTRRFIALQLSSLSTASQKVTRSSLSPTSPSLSAGPRSYLQDKTRPMTSKTRLLLGTSLGSRDSRSLHSGEPAVDAMRNNEDFGNWDTSAIEDAYENPFAPKTRVTKLETIPGSRPVSPAYALEAYLSHDTADQMPLPNPPLQPSTTCTSPPSASNPTRNNPQTKARRSNSNDQTHIHPLFRTESLVPPPLVSPGTIITASAYAGQVVSPGVALGPRLLASPTGSRPSTPNLAFLPSTRSNPASIKSLPSASSTFPVDAPKDSTPRTASPHLPLPND